MPRQILTVYIVTDYAWGEQEPRYWMGQRRNPGYPGWTTHMDYAYPYQSRAAAMAAIRRIGRIWQLADQQMPTTLIQPVKVVDNGWMRTPTGKPIVGWPMEITQVLDPLP